jgi:hypothetical protein
MSEVVIEETSQIKPPPRNRSSRETESACLNNSSKIQFQADLMRWHNHVCTLQLNTDLQRLLTRRSCFDALTCGGTCCSFVIADP